MYDAQLSNTHTQFNVVHSLTCRGPMKGLFNYFNVCGIILNYFTVIQLKVKKKKKKTTFMVSTVIIVLVIFGLLCFY